MGMEMGIYLRKKGEKEIDDRACLENWCDSDFIREIQERCSFCFPKSGYETILNKENCAYAAKECSEMAYLSDYKEENLVANKAAADFGCFSRVCDSFGSDGLYDLVICLSL